MRLAVSICAAITRLQRVDPSPPPQRKDASADATLRAMAPKTPVLDLFIGRDGDAWRLYVAPTSWTPELLRRRMDERGEIFPVATPGLADLDRVMNSHAISERRRF
jgi:hypothetical protein